jgi:hypothetical protein
MPKFNKGIRILTSPVARISSSEPILEFYCPACGSPILVSDEGLADSYCEHLVFIRDWVGETHYGEQLDEKLVEALQTLEEDDVEAIASVLPTSAVVFVLTETTRGGGHDGSEIAIAIDFLP